MIPSLRLRLCATVAAAVLAGSSAAAAPALDENGDNGDNDEGYLTVTFMGSLLEPTREMSATHDTALATGLRIGWTGTSGLGVTFDARYTPFPHEPGPLEEIEAHFFQTTAAMSYGYRSGVFRLWLAAGGAGIFERINTTFRMIDTTTEHRWAAGGHGAAGVDFLLFANGGPSFSGSYTHAVAGEDYSFYAGSAGVTFLF